MGLDANCLNSTSMVGRNGSYRFVISISDPASFTGLGQLSGFLCRRNLQRRLRGQSANSLCGNLSVVGLQFNADAFPAELESDQSDRTRSEERIKYRGSDG